MILYKTDISIVVERDGGFYALPTLDWDDLFRSDDPHNLLARAVDAAQPLPGRPDVASLQAPIGAQEVWAAGVTYHRSRDARMEESKDAGGGSFYDRVYEAERPELFFKATPHRVAGHGQAVHIRRDARWNVPEPELTLAVSATGTIFGYTIGNDMSSRDIEGENPLYLPQAKVYDRCAGLGPGILVTSEPLPPDTEIRLHIARGGQTAFEDVTQVGRIKRSLPSLVEFLFREDSFPNGCFLMTGTGIVPPDSFTLHPGDEIRITIEPIGTLLNIVSRR
ncbi:MAG: fumarylacetoacetate hydrolase family protein [Armatimonadota bacterium]|nr:fumarylacetoacetate hydrolase family protein [Armatimonadota bacterium]